MYLRIITLCLFAPALLTGCATATRGSTTMFIVETIPVGARVDITVPAKGISRLNKDQIKKIKTGKMEEPEYTYRYCEPTPCGIEMPRKVMFDILISKENYAPQMHTIGFLHRKQIAKETARNTALAAGSIGVAGGVLGGSFATIGGGAVTAGPVIAGAAVFAAPVLLIGAISGGVDAKSGANYDYWPNPASVTLDPIMENSTLINDEPNIFVQFEQARQIYKMTPKLSTKERRRKRVAQKEAEKEHAKQERKVAREAKREARRKEREEEREARRKGSLQKN